MPTVVKANAVKALNDQITRLEEQSRREINAKVIDCIKANSFSGFEDIMKEIEAITFDSFDKEPEGIRQKLYEERIVSIQPPEVSEYLKLQLREKIENVIMQEINNKSQDLTTKAGSLEKNAEYLKKISTYSLLTSAQKDRIIAKISTYLEKSFEITLRNMETNILENVGKEKDDLTETLRKYKEKSYAEGGFATLFETDKTPEMDKISKRIDNLLFNSGIRDWIVPDAYYASKQHTKVIDMNSNDTKFIVAAYFKDPEKGRSDDDKLTVALTEIHTQYENLNTKISADGKNKDFLLKMDEIKSNNVDIIKSDADRVAALMSMKKHILEMYKKQVYLFFGEPYNPNEADIHAKYDDTKFKEMSKPWITRLTTIDEECQKFLKSEEIRKSKTLSIYKNYQSAVKTIELLYNEPKEIVKLITQNQQNQPNR